MSSLNKKTAKDLLFPRFEVIADYPSNQHSKGTVLECPDYNQEFTKKYWVANHERYPHLFRKMNWWEKRTEEEMPTKMKLLSNHKKTIYEIKSWNMKTLIGTMHNGAICSIMHYKPEHGYIPID